MEERRLVELITQEVLKQFGVIGQGVSTVSEPRPLLVLTGDNQDSLQWQILLDWVKRSGQEFRVFHGAGESAKLPEYFQSRLVAGLSEQEMEQHLRLSSVVCLPWLPLGTLSRLVNLQPESPISLLITKALLQGVPVRARKVFVQPELNLYQSYDLSPIMRRVQGLVSEAKLLGIEWLTTDDWQQLFVSKAVVQQQGGKGLLTAADVQRLKGEGEIGVAAGTIVTPLARDELKRYGITLRMD